MSAHAISHDKHLELRKKDEAIFVVISLLSYVGDAGSDRAHVRPNLTPMRARSSTVAT